MRRLGFLALLVDRRASDSCHFEWRPRWTGPFRLEITNLNPVENDVVVDVL